MAPNNTESDNIESLSFEEYFQKILKDIDIDSQKSNKYTKLLNKIYELENEYLHQKRPQIKHLIRKYIENASGTEVD